MKKNCRRQYGFTLAEMLVVIVILGVLAGIAIPTYRNTMEQSRRNEACSNLNVIYMGQKIYRINNGTFWNPGNNPGHGNINNTLSVDITTSYYDITNITGAANTFSATARRNLTSGGDGATQCVFSYDNGTGVLTKTAGWCA